MAYFNPDFLEFFKELAGNNHKDWFDENRKRYEKEVKEPFKKFVADLIQLLDKMEGGIEIAPKDAIFRINRDIRFSKDKTPYKTYVSAVVSKGGKKDRTSPGLYVELSPEHFRVYGGLYELDKEDLLAVREYIVEHKNDFKKSVEHKDFVKTYGSIMGAKNKILPKHLKEFGDEIPLLFNKNFYYFNSMPPETILQEDLLDIIKENYINAKPIRTFLTKAIQS